MAKIFLWSFVSAIIGLILRIVLERSKSTGKIVAVLFGAVWSILTFFVVPILIFENLGLFSSIRKSGQLFKRTWGENVIGQISILLRYLLWMILGVIVMGVGIWLVINGQLIMGIIILAIVIIYFVILSIIVSSLNSIFHTALYIYANTGKVPDCYTPELIKNSFVNKNQ